MAVLLTTGLLAMLGTQGGSIAELLVAVGRELVVGAGVGLAIGFAASAVLQRMTLPARGLFPVAALSAALLTVGAAELLGGNGLLAAYVAGVVIGNRLRSNREYVLAFHDGLAWLAQIGLFLMLGLLVNPSQLMPLAGVAVALALFLMLVARPLAVTSCLLPFRAPWRERTFVSWVGLRGSVPIVLATYPGSMGMGGADSLFSLVFFVVLISVVIQGTTLTRAARALGVAE